MRGPGSRYQVSWRKPGRARNIRGPDPSHPSSPRREPLDEVSAERRGHCRDSHCAACLFTCLRGHRAGRRPSRHGRRREDELRARLPARPRPGRHRSALRRAAERHRGRSRRHPAEAEPGRHGGVPDGAAEAHQRPAWQGTGCGRPEGRRRRHRLPRGQREEAGRGRRPRAACSTRWSRLARVARRRRATPSPCTTAARWSTAPNSTVRTSAASPPRSRSAASSQAGRRRCS